MTDIIVEIDALVDEQLSGYHNRSGYDYNVNQDRCPHCRREWHGLKITRRMETMRRRGWYDQGYRFSEDESEIICPGSHFIGPWATTDQISWIRNNNEKVQRLRTDLALGKVFPGATVYAPAPAPDAESIDLIPSATDQVRNITRSGDLRLRPLGYPIPGGDLYALAVDSGIGGVLPASAWEYIVAADNGRYEIQETRRPAFDAARLNTAIENFSVGFTLLGQAAQRAQQIMTDVFAEFRFLVDPEPEPDTRTPQERALPRPSTTPPMWAVDAGRQRRTRTNSRRRHR